MLMAKNADICSKCLVTEPWVRSFTARSFAQRFNCSNSEYNGFQRHIVNRLRSMMELVVMAVAAATANCGGRRVACRAAATALCAVSDASAGEGSTFRLLHFHTEHA